VHNGLVARHSGRRTRSRSHYGCPAIPAQYADSLVNPSLPARRRFQTDTRTDLGQLCHHTHPHRRNVIALRQSSISGRRSSALDPRTSLQLAERSISTTRCRLLIARTGAKTSIRLTIHGFGKCQKLRGRHDGYAADFTTDDYERSSAIRGRKLVPRVTDAHDSLAHWTLRSQRIGPSSKTKQLVCPNLTPIDNLDLFGWLGKSVSISSMTIHTGRKCPVLPHDPNKYHQRDTHRPACLLP